MKMHQPTTNDWNKFVILNDIEYSYLYALIRCYMHILPNALKDSLVNHCSEHLVSLLFFIHDSRMLKLAHASLDNKNHQFMADMESILDEVTEEEYDGDIREYDDIQI